jgi:hypothetical protein
MIPDAYYSYSNRPERKWEIFAAFTPHASRARFPFSPPVTLRQLA